MKNRVLLFFLTLFIFLGDLSARPVSYPEGWTFITNNSGLFHMANLHYSPTAKFSVGYQGEYWRKEEYQSHFAMLNILAKRWNRKESQANFYVKSGIGASRSDHASNRRHGFSGFTGIALDWEDQRFFVSYENRFTEPGVEGFFHLHKARLGIAPYIGDYGDLHTWIMVQPEFVSNRKKRWGGSIFLRFFKDVSLVEIGFSIDKKIMLNYIHRY